MLSVEVSNYLFKVKHHRDISCYLPFFSQAMLEMNRVMWKFLGHSVANSCNTGISNFPGGVFPRGMFLVFTSFCHDVSFE